MNTIRARYNLLRNRLRQLGSRLPLVPRRHGRGQGLVEFALILPFLLLLMLGIIEFGYIFTVYSGMFNAARAGVRHGIVNPKDTAGIVTNTRSKVILADLNQVYITVAYDNGPETTPFTDTEQVQVGDRVLVHLTYNLPTLTPVIQPIVSTLHVEAEAARTVTSLGEIASFIDGGDGDGDGDGGGGGGEEEGGSAAIAVSVTANPQTVYSGDQVSFTYVVTNTGDLDLTDVIIEDSFGNTFNIPLLIAGATHVETVSETINATTTDTVTASGDDPLGGTASDSDSATVTVIGPALDLTVMVDPGVIYSGEVVTFTYIVENAGDAELTSVSVVDSFGTSVAPVSLAVGETKFWRVAYIIYGTTTNNVVATGADPAGGAVSDSESATVIVNLADIVIHEPLYEGNTTVTGTAQAGETVTIRDLMSDTFPSPDGVVQQDGAFEFTNLPPLVAGHVIVVEGYGTWDSAVVQGADPVEPITITTPLCHGNTTVAGLAEPERTVTLVIAGSGYEDSIKTDSNGSFTFTLPIGQPLQTGQAINVSGYEGSNEVSDAAVVEACTTDAYITISPQCGPVGSATIIVEGYNWDYKNKNDDVTINWDGNYVDIYDANTQPAHWEKEIIVNVVTSGTHQISAVNGKIPEVAATFLSPCPAPNLIITEMSLITSTDPISTYQPLDFSVTVENIGTRPINSLFWVDLYSAAPTSQTTGIAWAAVSSLGSGEDATIIVTQQSGFEITGTHQVWSSADSWHQVSELDENDNDAGPISVTVSAEGAPPTGTITGTGTIEGQTWIALSGFPVPHSRADVWCVNEAGDTVAFTISGDDGGYTLSNLPAGTYTVLAETWIDGSRYAGSRNNVTVSEGGTGVAIVIMY